MPRRRKELELRLACFVVALARAQTHACHHGCPQQQLYPPAAPLRLPAAGRGGLPDVLAARGPEREPRGGRPRERHPGEVRLQPREHPQPLRRRLLPAAHGEHLRGAGQRQRQVG